MRLMGKTVCVFTASAATILSAGTAARAGVVYQNSFEASDNPAFPDVTGPGFVVLTPTGPGLYPNPVGSSIGQFFFGQDGGIQRVVDAQLDPAAADGTQYAFIGNGNNFTNIATDQTLSSADPAATNYTFTVALGTRARDSAPTNTTINVGLIDFAGTDLNTVRAVNVTSLQRSSLPVNGFADYSVTLPADTFQSGDVVRLFVDKTGPGGDGVSLIVLDNFRLIAAVPEPGSLGLLTGATALLRRRRRA